MTKRVVLLPGEGIGPEVAAAALRVVKATGVEIEWDVRQVGAASYRQTGSALPGDVVEAIRECGVALKGPLETPLRSEAYRSVNVAMRAPLDLFVQVRPVRSWKGVRSAVQHADLVMIRSITEDLSAGIEYEEGSVGAQELIDLVARHGGGRLDPSSGVGIKPISRRASRRTWEFAFRHAERYGRRRVTAAHKATVQRRTDGLFLEVGTQVASEHPDMAFDGKLVDALAAELVRRAADYDVVVAPALYGDILSDLAAALTGGLGLAAGASYGDEVAVFEPAHGTVPRHAGADRVNPLAMILSAAMLLSHIGEPEAALSIHRAVGALLEEGDQVTYDLPVDRGQRVVGTNALADAVAGLL
ncbi:MAG: isocitrate/isopropylmalate family dehydrogenase [Actinomycetota bacterium]|nr:isocitrate/isopropylmalate family dehydrogenase [Actinomycetota bacterium]